MSRYYEERAKLDSKKEKKKLPKALFFRICWYRLSSSWAPFESKGSFEQNYTVDDSTVKIFCSAKSRNPWGNPQHFTLPSSPRERPHERNEGQLGPKIHRYLWTFGAHAGTRPADYNMYDSLMARRLPIFQQYLMESCFGRRPPLNITSKVHLNFLLTLAQSQAFSWSKPVLFINPNQMNSFLNYSFWQLQVTPRYLRVRRMQVKTIVSSQTPYTPTSTLTNPNIFAYPAQLLYAFLSPHQIKTW